jgi:hypothetical protein
MAYLRANPLRASRACSPRPAVDATFWEAPRAEREARLRELDALVAAGVPPPPGKAYWSAIGLALLLDAQQVLDRRAMLAAAVNQHEPSTLRSLLLPTVGHQLLPSQNRQWVHSLAWLYLLLKALYCSFLWRLLRLPPLLRLRERLLVVEEEEEEGTPVGSGAAPAIGTILESAPSSDLTYNASAEVISVFRVRASLAVCACFLINALAWAGVLGASYLPQGASAQGAASLLAWALDAMVLLIRALTQQRPSYMGFACVALFISILSAVAFALAVIERLPIVLPYAGTGRGDLPSVMPLILDVRNTPFAMVSYAWGDPESPYARTARALAAALPNCWVDQHMLSSGSTVPLITAEVARSAHLLVLVLTPEYLHSKNCAIELVAALLHRGRHQATWAYAAPGVLPESVLRHFSARLGVRVFSSIRQLLLEADRTIYRVARQEDVARLMKWFAVYGDARESVSRTFRLPPPEIQRGSALPCSSCRSRSRRSSSSSSSSGSSSSSSRVCPHLCRPRRAVHAGHAYLAADALEQGVSLVWVPEQLMLLACVAGLAACFALLQQGYARNIPIGATRPWDVPLSTWLPLPIVVASVLTVAVVGLLPFALHLDVRTHHSPLLLPLCAAAFIQAYEGGLKEEGAGGGGSGGAAAGATPGAAAAPRSTGGERELEGHITFLFAVGDATGSPLADPHLEARLDNVMAFMQSLGLVTQRVAYGPRHPCPRALREHQTLCVAVFVLRSRGDAEHWLRTHCGQFSLDNTILVWDGEEGATAAGAQPPAVSVAVAGGGVATGQRLYFNDYIFLPVRQMCRGPGREGCGAYDGFAAMLLDHIGAKIGSAFLSALRRQVHVGKESNVMEGGV